MKLRYACARNEQDHDDYLEEILNDIILFNIIIIAYNVTPIYGRYAGGTKHNSNNYMTRSIVFWPYGHT